MRTLRIGLAQINTTVGALQKNADCILSMMREAYQQEADLIAFPELALTGYPPEDLLLKPSFIAENLRWLRWLAEESAHLPGLTAVIGFVDRDTDLYNAAALVGAGQLLGIYYKQYLPNYGVFDENRYFQAGTKSPVYVINGINIGVNICEDMWYPTGPTTAQAFRGAELIVNINASPYHAGKSYFREQMIATRAADNAVIVAYTNLVGGQDELIFDGASLIANQQGRIIARGKQFEEDLLLADLDIEGVFRARLHDPRRRKERLAYPLDQVPSILISASPMQMRKPQLPEDMSGAPAVYSCSNCGKRQDQSRRFIAGSPSLFICASCIQSYYEVAASKLAQPVRVGGRAELPCAICEKDSKQLPSHIAGPGAVCLCNKCIEQSNRLLAEKSPEPARTGGRKEIPETVIKSKPSLATRGESPYDRLKEIYSALVLGTRDYVRKNGFGQVVIGLSGGIDSSLTAAIAVDALGPENVMGISMPSGYSSAGSKDDARALAENLRIKFQTIPIEDIFRTSLRGLEDVFKGTQPGLAEENLQARIRGNLLMAISNKLGSLVLACGNKSEMATGYSTLYGDMAGGYAVIKDVFKTLVYELAEYRNSSGPKPVIPRAVLEKEPSAELRPDQRDVDSLPPYPILDPILRAYVEEDRGADEIVALGFERSDVVRAIRLVDLSEYKRRQAAPGIKITPRAFGRDRRLPLTNGYRG